MKHIGTALALFAATGLAHASGQWWPPSLKLADGTSLALTGSLAYDANRFGGDDAGLEDAEGRRRAEFGFSAKRKDYFDAGAQYEFESRTWMDLYARVHSRGLLGRDVGSVRAGWFKTPVGLDGLTASRAPAFVEAALPGQAIYAGRRTGVEWALNRPHYHVAAAYFGGNDPEGTDMGTTWGGRAVWTPMRAEGDVLHLGLAGSAESPAGDAARFRARPEAGLTDVRLIDSRRITHVERIDRAGLEFIRVRGPLTVQAEYLVADAHRSGGRPDVGARGGSVWVGWTVTGESRPYNGTLGNIEPQHGHGALELLARLSTLELDDAVGGGMQTNMTLGANYYWSEHVRVQLNYVRNRAGNRESTLEPTALLLRGQIQF